MYLSFAAIAAKAAPTTMGAFVISRSLSSTLSDFMVTQFKIVIPAGMTKCVYRLAPHLSFSLLRLFRLIEYFIYRLFECRKGLSAN